MTPIAAAQSPGANHAQAKLQIRVQVVPVAASLPQTPAPRTSSFASVAYNIPGDALNLSIMEETRPLRAADKAPLVPPARASDALLKTTTIVLR